VINLGEHAEGWILPVRAQPGARKNGPMGERDGALKIAVTAPPADGRANKAIIETLCKLLDVKRSQVQLISGDRSRDKRFLIVGCAKEQLLERVAALAET
jgi:uncharacterized protein (TIGR00251 family)